MSPHGINTLVGDLVQMAQATERLPQVEAELERANTQIENYAKQVQDREIKIISLKAENEELISRIRSLEVERDDASFRVLEAEDREHTVLDMARSIASAVGNVISTLDPPKPQPESVPEATIATSEAVSEAPQVQPVATPAETSASQGQSESNPTTTDAPIQTATASGSVEPQDSSKPKLVLPYSRGNYIDVPYFVSRLDWIEGGGTHESYDFRPIQPLASGSY